MNENQIPIEGDDDNETPAINQDEQDFVRKVQRQFKKSKDHTAEWREEARRAYDYRACRQWTEDEISKRNEMRKPSVTFNRSEVFVQAVCGMESLNRLETKYVPRVVGPQQSGVSDLYTAAADYVNEESDAESKHSHAFADMVTCGMGWTFLRTDYDKNPDGDLVIERLSPLSMFWDQVATQRNITDAEWILHIESKTRKQVKELWPDKYDDLSGKGFFNPAVGAESPVDADNSWRYEDNERTDEDSDNIFIAHYQWFERDLFYRVATPEGIKEVPVAEWEKMLATYPEAAQMPSAKAWRRKYFQAFICGSTLLEKVALPTSAFTIQALTGKHDQTKNLWYGLLRNLFDPQDWVNTLYSQILHVINSNSKGGLLAEKDAFDSVQEAEENWSSSSAIIWTRPGGIGKIQERQPLEYPAGYDRLLQFAMNMFTDVTGASMELLGLAEKVQPGVLEAQRKQAGMTILSWAFDSMRAYKKVHGRILAELIKFVFPDQRLIRITTPQGAQFIPFMRQSLAPEYDVIVNDAPSSVDEKARVFQVLMQLLPMLLKTPPGSLPPTMFDYLPLPATLIEDWKKLQQPDPMRQQMDQAHMQAQMADMQAKTADTQAATQLKQAQAVKVKVDTVI